MSVTVYIASNINNDIILHILHALDSTASPLKTNNFQLTRMRHLTLMVGAKLK